MRRKHETVLIPATPGQVDEEYLHIDAAHTASQDPVEDEGPSADALRDVLGVINDGFTLTAREYRTVRMAIEHHTRNLKPDADYVKRATGLPLRGLSLQLTLLSKKLALRSGRLDAIADRLGLTIDEETKVLRRRRLRGLAAPLTERERQQILHTRGASDRDFAMIYGVDPKTIWVLRRKAGRA